ncbi:MAG: thiamine pyrophosphokinae [Acidimicrobiia bacterium]|nr:thiamine pyrophosphokinae [Acidimicrobiia bacterium]
MTTDHVLVFAGGEPSRPPITAGLPEHAKVIAADSGATHARAAGRRVDLLVGDLDSIPPHELAQLEQQGTEVRRYPPAKDSTDLALALDAAVALRPRRITLVGGHGGRLDHFLANMLLLASPEYRAVEIDALMDPARILVVRGRRTFAGDPGELVSLLPVGGPATGVGTEGLLFPLRDARLEFGSSLGVSNQMVFEQATVEVREGVVLVVLPGQQGAL